MTTITYQTSLSPVKRAWIAAKLGWYVMPLRRETKIPAMKKWQHESFCDPDEVERIRAAAIERGRLERRQQGIPAQITDHVMTAMVAALLYSIRDHYITAEVSRGR